VAQRNTMTLADRVNTQLLIYRIISPTIKPVWEIWIEKAEVKL